MIHLLQKPVYNRSLLLSIIVTLFIFSGCEESVPNGESPESIRDHVTWLADDAREGRLAGSPQEAEAANYIADQFLYSGLIPAGDEGTYFQQFVLEGPMPQAMGIENHVSRNVVGLIEGSEYPDQYIIIGAHYDSQGMGGMISMSEDEEPAIHNGADDNASGTAGLIWLADQLSDYQPQKSLLFVAFSGEELGLLGSRFFVNNMEMETDQITAMLNFDMIGRLSDGELTIFGTGTSEVWPEILDSISADSLTINRSESGSGASDHQSFYEADIPVLHYFTGIHDDYHRETDTADKINYTGMEWVLNHAKDLIRKLDGMEGGEISFDGSRESTESPQMFDGPTMGVLPDYSYSNGGFRVDGVREGEPAEVAGMERGDVIVYMAGTEISDIYDYMDALQTLESGQEITVRVIRDGEELELSVQF